MFEYFFLRLPQTTGTGGCFTFWYHMYGTGIGSLNIYISVAPTQNTTIWSLTGNQQNAWLNGQAPVNSPLSSFFVSATRCFTTIFIGL